MSPAPVGSASTGSAAMCVPFTVAPRGPCVTTSPGTSTAPTTASAPNAAYARAACHGPPPMRGAEPATTSRERCPTTASIPTPPDHADEGGEREREGEARHRRADLRVQRVQPIEEACPETEIDGCAGRGGQPLVA